MSASDIIKASAQLACDDIYDPVTPGVFGKVYRVGESVCGTVVIGNAFVITMQGTELEEVSGDGASHFSLAGWGADFDCLVPFVHPVLGPLHAGFYEDLPALIEQLKPDIPAGARVYVIGHSKGAGQAPQLGALLKLAGVNVVGHVLFAPPHAGYQQFADWLAKNIPGVAYRNAPQRLEAFGDPVPLVPPSPYVPSYPLTYVDAPPAGLERMLSVQWHKGALYIQGVNAIT